MSSVCRYIKEPTSLRRQFSVFPYFGYNPEATNGNENNIFFTVSDGTLYRIQSDIRSVDYVVARDMGTEMAITNIDSALLPYLVIGETVNSRVVRNGTARKFQVLSIVSGNYPTGDMFFSKSDGNNGNIGGNGQAYADSIFPNNNLFNTNGTADINDLLIVGSGDTTTTATTQTLPFGTFWAVNDPIVIQYDFSATAYKRTIKNRIDETTFFG
jgi:hypothetical protein